jgi:hypothetical protein
VHEHVVELGGVVHVLDAVGGKGMRRESGRERERIERERKNEANEKKNGKRERESKPEKSERE